MIIIYRISEANIKPQSLGENANPIRWNGKTKPEILRKCWLSLQPGLTDQDTIKLVADAVTDETIEWLKNNTKAYVEVHKVSSGTSDTHPYPQYFDRGINSCIPLMEKLIQTCKEQPNELIYLCEDDYLHLPHAIKAMKALYAAAYIGFYVPYDYPDRYTDFNYKADIKYGPYGAIRSVPSATLTVAALGHAWLKYEYVLLRSGIFSEDSWTWKAFSQTPAYSPIPGHATHLQEHCITPFIDWNNVWDSINET